MAFKYIYNYWLNNKVNNKSLVKKNIWSYYNNYFFKIIFLNKINYLLVIMEKSRIKNINVVSEKTKYVLKISVLLISLLIFIMCVFY